LIALGTGILLGWLTKKESRWNKHQRHRDIWRGLIAKLSVGSRAFRVVWAVDVLTPS